MGGKTHCTQRCFGSGQLNTRVGLFLKYIYISVLFQDNHTECIACLNISCGLGCFGAVAICLIRCISIFKGDVVCYKRKQMYAVMSVLAASWVPPQAHLFVNISCLTLIRAEQYFNVCLHICSPYLYPILIIMTYCSYLNKKTQWLYAGLLYVLFEHQSFYFYLLKLMQLLLNSCNISATMKHFFLF